MRARVEHSKQPTAALCGSDQDEAPALRANAATFTQRRRRRWAGAGSPGGGSAVAAHVGLAAVVGLAAANLGLLLLGALRHGSQASEHAGVSLSVTRVGGLPSEVAKFVVTTSLPHGMPGRIRVGSQFHTQLVGQPTQHDVARCGGAVDGDGESRRARMNSTQCKCSGKVVTMNAVGPAIGCSRRDADGTMADLVDEAVAARSIDAC